MKTNYSHATMHKQSTFRTSMLMLLVLLCSLPTWANQFSDIKKKEIEKSFTVSKNDLLQVDNRYGNITISHWNKNEVAIRVEIEAKANSEKKAQAILDRIHIQMEKTNHTVSAVTSLDPDNSSGNNQSFSIKYFINIPEELSCSLTQRFGNINMPENNKGKCNLQTKYGNINGGNFYAPLEVEAKYGNIIIANTTDKLEVECKYGNLTVGKVKQMDVEIKYGNLQIKELENGSLDQGYGNSTIQKITEGITISDLGYGTLNIKELSPNFKKVSIEASYSTVNIDMDKNASFHLIAEDMKYGNCRVKGFNVTQNNQTTHTSDFDSQEIKKNNDYYDLSINSGKGGKIHFNGNKFSNIKITAL